MRYLYFAGLLITYGVSVAPVHAQTPASTKSSGYYVGGSIASVKGEADTKASTTLVGSTYFTSPDDVQIAAAGNGTISDSHVSGGIFAGYWKQYGNVVVGAEASVNSLQVDKSRTQTVTYQSAPPSQFTLTQTVKADWQGTLRLRLGYKQEKWLAYVTGEVLWHN